LRGTFARLGSRKPCEGLMAPSCAVWLGLGGGALVVRGVRNLRKVGGSETLRRLGNTFARLGR
jgi:hypothetical protein